MATEKRLDLIDREKVYENACAGCTRHGEKPGECYLDEPCERLIFAFTVAKSVDAVEVVHGRWIDAREYCGDYMCSNCDALYGTNKFKYCPNCGAKMDGDGNG